jgi:hypothetical protein
MKGFLFIGILVGEPLRIVGGLNTVSILINFEGAELFLPGISPGDEPWVLSGSGASSMISAKELLGFFLAAREFDWATKFAPVSF